MHSNREILPLDTDKERDITISSNNTNSNLKPKQKSRNPLAGVTGAGMNSAEKALFNSNKE